MAMEFNALCAESINNLQLDAGVLAVGKFNIGLWDGVFKNGSPGWTEFQTLGATKGSISINITPETRNLFDGIDGARGYYIGGTVIDTWDITVKATLSEMTLKNMQLALTSGKHTVKSTRHIGSAPIQYNEIVPILDIPKKQYQNIYWIGKMAKTDAPIIIEFTNALNMNGFNITAEDKSTGTYEVEFRPHIDLSQNNGTDIPLKIFLPVNAQEVGRLNFEEVKIDLKK